MSDSKPVEIPNSSQDVADEISSTSYPDKIQNSYNTISANHDVEVQVECVPELSEQGQLAALKIRKIMIIEAKNKKLREDISLAREKLELVKGRLKNPDASATVKNHIKLLHDYNDIRDVGQGLMGLIADQRNTTLREIYAEFGADEKD